MKTDPSPTYTFTQRALVLRCESTKGANRTLWLLTAEQGLMRVSAYGSGKAQSPLAGATQTFCYSDFTLLSKHGMPRIEDAVCIDPFRELTQDFVRFSLASYFSELLCDMAPSGLDAADTLKCTLAALYALARQNRDPELVRAAFTFRLLCDSGFEPSLSGSGDRFSIVQGQIGREGIPLTPGAVQALRHAQSAPFAKLFAFSLGNESLDCFSQVCEQYARSCLERAYPTLDYYKSLL